MAAVSSSAWGKPGAWALDAEENEAELLHQHKQDINSNNSNNSNTVVTDFPSLSAAATTKTKKKKPQTVSLQQFTTKTTSYQPNKGLTSDELFSLPTAPRERSAEELERSKLGGGFRSYGNGGGAGGGDQIRRGRDSDREFVPSRSDGVDNWGAEKKPSFGGGFERKERGERERGGYFTDSQSSRADEVDNWASKKSFVPSVETRRYERSGGVDSSDWGKGRRSGGAFDSLGERRGGGFETRKVEEGSGVNESGSGSRPKLNLQPRTKPVSEDAVNNKPKGSSPFGDARPREEVLKEKGQDWKEIDEKLESVKIKDGNGWRKMESSSSLGQSDAGSENGQIENTENGQAEETEQGVVKI